jgi:hypothetical protein
MRKLRRRRVLQVAAGTVFLPLITKTANGAENDTGTMNAGRNIAGPSTDSIYDAGEPHNFYYFAANGPGGMGVYVDGSTDNLLKYADQSRVALLYQAPSLAWRPSDGRLIITSATMNNVDGEYHSMPVPFAWYTGYDRSKP